MKNPLHFVARIDFETRSKIDLKKCGAFKYAEDLSTEVLCLSYQLPGKPIQTWHPFSDELAPFDLLKHIENGYPVESHNAEFEYCIWNYCATRLYGWTKLPLKQLYCSASMAAALSLPRSLEGLALALDIPVKKDMEGRRLMLKMSKPKKNLEEWHDDLGDFERLIEYCENDVRVEALAAEKLEPLTAFEQKVFWLSLKINERGIKCDTDLIDKAIVYSFQFENEAIKELTEITSGEVTSPNQTAKILAFINTYSTQSPLVDLSALTVTEALKTETHPIVKRVLQIRQALAKSSVKKLKAMRAMACKDKRIRGTILYHGAGTGRFSGKGIQPQNFSRGFYKEPENILKGIGFGDYEFFKIVYPDVFTAISSVLRQMLIADNGKVLNAGDFNAIEARVLLWLANDEINLDEFRAGGDPYKAMAAVIFKVPVSEVTKTQRELGKRAVLGAGYGMGAPKFKDTCKTQGGLEIPIELADRAIQAYRTKYFKVKAFWYGLENACKDAIINKGKLHKVGKLQILYRGDFLKIMLPSGRCLAYYKPHLRPRETPFGMKDTIAFWSVDSVTKKWGVEFTYGGKLVENVTQAVARDIMVNSMINLETTGFPVIFTVHDEIICEVEPGRLPEFLNTMQKLPSWAEGLPIKVEGWEKDRYQK